MDRNLNKNLATSRRDQSSTGLISVGVSQRRRWVGCRALRFKRRIAPRLGLRMVLVRLHGRWTNTIVRIDQSTRMTSRQSLIRFVQRCAGGPFQVSFKSLDHPHSSTMKRWLQTAVLEASQKGTFWTTASRHQVNAIDAHPAGPPSSNPNVAVPAFSNFTTQERHRHNRGAWPTVLLNMRPASINDQAYRQHSQTNLASTAYRTVPMQSRLNLTSKIPRIQIKTQSLNHNRQVATSRVVDRRIVQRVLDRTRRKDEPAKHITTTVTSRTLAQGTPHQVQIDRANEQPSIRQRQTPQVTAPHCEMNSRFQAMPVINIETLSDQVLKKIDRRITSWRERMGQI